MASRSYASRRLMGMGHDHPGEENPCDAPKEHVFNLPHYHAFALLGKERLFASHLTQLWCEVHKYQFIFEVSLPELLHSAIIKERALHPRHSYFLANALLNSKLGSTRDDPMTVPELAAGLRTSFIGNVFRGLPYEEEYAHWPWEGVRPVFANIPVSIKRIVHFRPFSETMNYPETLTYLLFGGWNDAHIVHYQTKEPDFDHMASLLAAPSWLDSSMLEAGVLIDLPDVPRSGATVRCTSPFEDGATIQVRYRGAGPHRPITIERTHWFCTKICNSDDPCSQYKFACDNSPEYVSG